MSDPEQGDGLSGQVTDNCKKVERPIVEVIRTLTNIRGQGANFNLKIFYAEIKTREDLNDFTKFFLHHLISFLACKIFSSDSKFRLAN